MIERPVPRPSNRWIQAERDRRWPVAFAGLALLSVLLVGALALVGWPRLRAVTLHYQLATLRAEVDELEHRKRELEIRVQALTAPASLEPVAESLGLSAPAPTPTPIADGGGR